MSRPLFRSSAATLALAWVLSACTSWRPLPAPQLSFSSNVERIRLRIPGRGEIVVWYPEVRGDSLFGASSRDLKDSRDIRLGNIRSLQIRRFSATRTVALVAGVTVGGFLLVGGIAAAICGANNACGGM